MRRALLLMLGLTACSLARASSIHVVASVKHPVASATGVSHRRRAPLAAPPAVELLALNTHETFHLQPAPNGALGPKQLRGWTHFLRCHHTGRQHAMAPRLAQLLYQTGRHFDRRLLVVAGYRAPKIAREKGNPKSPHKSGLACDFRVDGIANEELRDWVRATFNKVGVGYYPNSGFVHLDVGRKVSAFWVDLSFPGERARYAEDPEGLIRQPATPEASAPALAPAVPTTPTNTPADSKKGAHVGDGGAAPQGVGAAGAGTPKSPFPDDSND